MLKSNIHERQAWEKWKHKSQGLNNNKSIRTSYKAYMNMMGTAEENENQFEKRYTTEELRECCNLSWTTKTKYSSLAIAVVQFIFGITKWTKPDIFFSIDRPESC